jgi:imidazole glycerol-phosphate synthase subunit HisH
LRQSDRAQGAAMISIVDYGVSNLGSIRNMLRKLGLDSEIASSPEQVAAARKLILPGVGAFDHGATALNERGLTGPLRRQAMERKVPLLGICLGMQLLGKGSEEGVLGGLGLIDACCMRFRLPEGSTLKVPHMGWNEPFVRRHAPLVDGLDPRARFYFTHSYHLVCADAADVVAVATHGVEFTAIVQRENVMGVQFHPEKSHRFGMALLRNFGMM